MALRNVNKLTLVGFGGFGLTSGILAAMFIIGGYQPAPRAAGVPQPAQVEPANDLNAAMSALLNDGDGAASGAAASADRDTPPTLTGAARTDAVAETVALLGDAHTRLHEDDDAGSDLLEEMRVETQAHAGLRLVHPKRDLVREIYREAGVGHFVRTGRLTPLGRAVYDLLGEIDRHGIEGAYDPVEVATALEGIKLEADTGSNVGNVSALAKLLVAPHFDPVRTTARIATMNPVPDRAAVAQAVADVKGKGVGNVATAEDVRPDVHLMEVLVQLTLDFRFVKRAGPQELRTSKTILRREKLRKRLLDRVLEILGADDGPAAVRSLLPRHPQYHQMLAFHDRYLGFENGDCPKLVPSWKIRPGMSGDEVRVLQRRLRCEGYYDGPLDNAFEGATLAAAQQYQRHHELEAKGFVFEETIKSMNVPLSRRVDQIKLVLQRMRESDVEKMRPSFIRVNIPAFEAQMWENGKVIDRKKVIVGTNRLDDDKQALIQGHINRTKLFETQLYEVVVNPAWILPPRVENGELKGSIAKDPDYLKKHNIKRITLKGGKQVYVQGYGEGNVLGRVKFLLRESNAIYLHDTDKPDLFKHKRRDYSHGCVRVDQAVDFAKWILARDGWDDKEVKRAFRTTSYQRGFELKQPIDLITEYMTVDVSDEGLPMFLTDIYRYDDAYFEDELPAQEVERWGAAKLRPHWVPRVSEDTVARWRAKGMHAPRNYDPAVHGP